MNNDTNFFLAYQRVGGRYSILETTHIEGVATANTTVTCINRDGSTEVRNIIQKLLPEAIESHRDKNSACEIIQMRKISFSPVPATKPI